MSEEISDERMVALTAQMEGEAIIVRTIGRKIKVSQMELVALCNFAQLGLLHTFSQLDGEAGAAAATEIDDLEEAIRKAFARRDNADGLARLAQGTVAILGEARLGKYLVRTD
jgi:hypothetical protein